MRETEGIVCVSMCVCMFICGCVYFGEIDRVLAWEESCMPV